MPTYLIEQYETHYQTYEVVAKNEVEAVAAVLNGTADASDNGAECIEVNNDLGMPAEEDPELHDELRRRGLVSSKDFIDSIRRIEEVS